MSSRLLCILIAASLASGARAGFAQQLAYTGPRDEPIAGSLRARLGALARARQIGFVDLSESAPAPSPAPGLCRGGIAAFEKLQVGDAERGLDACLAELARAGGAALSTREIADVHLYRAMVAIERAQPEAARDQLVAAATVAPAYALDTGRFRPSLVAAFERARVAVVETAAAVVELDVPDGCRARIDGADRTGTAELELRPGAHYVAITCPRREPFAAAATFSPGRQRYRPPLVARPPARQRVLAASAASVVYWVELEGRRVAVRALERGRASARQTWRLELATPVDASRVEAIIAAALEPRSRPAPVEPVVITREPERRWYESRWLWVGAGVVAGAAIILPFALSNDDNNGFQIVPDGVPR